MNTIQPFVFEPTGQAVRTIVRDGEPWLVGRDVALALGYVNPRDALSKHVPDHHRGVSRIATPSGQQEMTIISEPGMYRLILRSNTELADQFQEWVTAYVLPTIRRTGSFSVAPPAPALPDLTTPQGVLALAEQFKRTAEQLVDADARVKELEPKALAHDTLMAAQDGDVLVRQAAKILGWKERDLRAFLLEEKLIYRRQQTCGGFEYDFYAAYSAHFNAVKTVVEHRWGPCAHYTLHLTPRGLAFVQMRLEKRRGAMRAAIAGSP